MNSHREQIKLAHEALDQVKAKVRKHSWHLHYHVAPVAGWANDPNGFCFYNGEFHLFYQHHPFSPEWGPMYWGHVKSKDLVHWEHQPIALAPSETYDKDGCFSGSAIEKDGKLYLMYTGNVWTGDNHDKDLKQVQALAISEDGGLTFEKYPGNPVISKAPNGDIHPFHIRDPKVWKVENNYYAVLGSRTKSNVGQVLLYRSTNLIDWDFINVMAKGEGNLGYMWECPDFFRLDGMDYLVLSPQGMIKEGHYFHNLHQAGYFVGLLNYETGKYQHGPFNSLDYGFDFYAPQTTVDDRGRRILIAWMDMWESEMPTKQGHFAGALSIPRLLEVRNSTLFTPPVPEMELLRGEEVNYEHQLINGEHKFPNIYGDTIELELIVDLKEATTFGINVRMNEEGTEYTNLHYNLNEHLLTLDRNLSGKGPKGVRQTPFELSDGVLRLRLFIDTSSIEVFINNGQKVMTARIYPDNQSTGVQFYSNQQVELIALKKWKIKQSI